jgi:large subunit ribosomal protein L24
MVARIKKNDSVMIISGKDKGKTGTVLDIAPKKNKVLVKGLGIVTKHYKARKQGEVSSIKQIETYIPLSKVMPICPMTKKPVRTGSQLNEQGKRVRISGRSKKVF